MGLLKHPQLFALVELVGGPCDGMQTNLFSSVHELRVPLDHDPKENYGTVAIYLRQSDNRFKYEGIARSWLIAE